jgi:hypothetical protein
METGNFLLFTIIYYYNLFNYGFDKNLIKLLKNYFSSRIDGIFSSLDIELGAPQDSVLADLGLNFMFLISFKIFKTVSISINNN